MGIAQSLILFIGLPAAAIVGIGFLLTQFRDPIIGAARTTGEVFSNIFTQPIAGFIQGTSQVLGNLPDIELRIPGINVSGGLLSFTQEQPPRDIGGESGSVPGGTVEFQPGTMFDPNTGIISGRPPEITLDQPFIPEAEAAGLTLFEPNRSILVNFPALPGESGLRRERLTRSEIVETFPDVVGLFDVLSTSRTEFLPFSVSDIAAFGAGGLRLSGQVFQEFGNISDIPGT